jgi:hypothetical protein
LTQVGRDEAEGLEQLRLPAGDVREQIRRPQHRLRHCSGIAAASWVRPQWEKTDSRFGSTSRWCLFVRLKEGGSSADFRWSGEKGLSFSWKKREAMWLATCAAQPSANLVTLV